MTREEAIKMLRSKMDGNTDTSYEWCECVRMAIKALEQEACEDEHIKVPKKALKYRTLGMVAYNAEWLKNHFDVERAVICGAQEPCDDAISRQAVLDLIEHYNSDGLGSVFYGYEQGVKFAVKVNKLPHVNPQVKIGHWVDKDEKSAVCSCCNCNNTLFGDYCKWCGAKMSELQESGVKE